MKNKIFHRDAEFISNLYAVIIILVVTLSIGIMIISRKHAQKYHISAQEMHAQALKFEDIITPDVLTEIIYSKDTVLYRFVDLRSAQEYLQGHLPGAINIPASKILNEEYAEVFNQDKVINILYSNAQAETCGHWMILSQLGYNNNKVLQGGYKFAKNHIVDSYAPFSGKAADEKAAYDFAAEMKKLSSGAPATAGDAVSAPVITPAGGAPKKKQEGGGC
jgi:rhodanese-related sulfurtransferase